ncbi:MAG: GDSL-type esterase/lipase family protein [Emergencia sp.]|nr:GDSL-type esterase/lipase family protein [Emergencia sp.]
MTTRTKRKKYIIRDKKYLIFIIVLFIFASIFLWNLLRENASFDYDNHRIKNNIATIATFDYSKVTSIEDEIRQLEVSEAKGTFDVNKVLSNDQYRKIFSTSVILGDSITEGLVDYGYLGNQQVFCQIGASIINGDDLFTASAKVYPSYAFMSFGMNDMGNYNGSSSAFIEKYTELIKAFQAASPDTKILINGITPPAKQTIAENPIYGNYKKFNNALKEMCKRLNLTYIDNTYLIEENPEYYAGDGIHVTSDYYPYWMNNMILKAGL